MTSATGQLPGRSRNAALAADMFRRMVADCGLGPSTAWQGIASLLLTCDVWDDGWTRRDDVVAYRESSDLGCRQDGRSAVRRKAEALSLHLAEHLGCRREDLRDEIGLYWRHPSVRRVQPNNLVHHAFRSIVVEALRMFGRRDIRYEEEIDLATLWPDLPCAASRSRPCADVVAFDGDCVVALLSVCWRFRQNRIAMLSEADAFMPSAKRANPSARFYGVVGEFSAARLEKVLNNCAPAHANPAITATVHFNPALVRDGLGESGRIAHLKSLEWLIGETHKW